jgi:hypothetical protein
MLPRVAFQAVQAVNSMTDDKLEAARDEGDHQLSNSRNIISRDEAKALDLKRFFTGKPCKRGHIAERSVHSGRCLECGRARSAKWKAANQKRVRETRRKYRAANLEKLREKDREATRRRYIKKQGRDSQQASCLAGREQGEDRCLRASVVRQEQGQDSQQASCLAGREQEQEIAHGADT